MKNISSNCLNFPGSSPFCIDFKGILLVVRFKEKQTKFKKKKKKEEEEEEEEVDIR